MLTLQGEGTLTVPFDKVKVRVQITCKSQGVNTATVAQTQNQETAKDFMVALEDELGIGKKNLKMGKACVKRKTKQKTKALSHVN